MREISITKEATPQEISRLQNFLLEEGTRNKILYNYQKITKVKLLVQISGEYKLKIFGLVRGKN